MQEDVSRELLFVQSLEKVRRIAKEQGNRIREEQVREEFSELDLNESQMEMVFDYLTKHRIVSEKSDGNGASAEEAAGEENAGKEDSTDEFLTEKEREYLRTYLDEIERLSVRADALTEADVTAAMAGDTQARHRLMESFLKNVADIAKLYAGQGVLLEDLIGEGNMALAMGLEMLDSMETSGGKAEKVQGLLAKRVMDAMEELIRQNAACEKADKKAAAQVNRVADKARALAEELRRKVTPQELAEETGLSVKVIQDAMRMSGYKIEDIAMEKY